MPILFHIRAAHRWPFLLLLQVHAFILLPPSLVALWLAFHMYNTYTAIA
jgi:hypothetical protein